MGNKKIALVALCILILALIGCQKDEAIDIRGEITAISKSTDRKSVV